MLPLDALPYRWDWLVLFKMYSLIFCRSFMYRWWRAMAFSPSDKSLVRCMWYANLGLFIVVAC